MRDIVPALLVAAILLGAAACASDTGPSVRDRCHTVTLVRFEVSSRADAERYVTFGCKTYRLAPGSITEFAYERESTYAIDGHEIPLPLAAPRDEFGAIEVQIP
jgi:hypothetical protein